MTYHGAPGDTSPVDDTIDLFASDADNLSQAIAVQHLTGSMDGTLTFTAPDEVGTYNIRMLTSGTITIAVTPDIHVHTQAVLSAAPSVAVPYGLITVTYSGAPGSQSDWIGMCAADAPDGQSVSSQFLNGAKGGVLTFNAPDKAGTYNFRMFTGDVQTALATSNDVQVENMVVGTPVQIVLRAYSPAMTVNGANTIIDPASGAVPIIKNGRTLLPVRAIVESIGEAVKWDAASQTVTLTYKRGAFTQPS